MKRPLTVIVIAALALSVYLLTGSTTSSYRVDAIFDTADNIVPGQLVKIAGAKVGTITGVTLAPGPTARLELSIDARYGPFHTDASCQILPEGPISENFVECDPGSVSTPTLRPAAHSSVPTVAITHTTVPVSLQDVINVFSLPVSERASVLINELGIGTAGEGGNLNAILRRANPALVQGDRVLSILDAQNHQIANAVGQSNQVVSELATRTAATRQFVDQAATVASTTAAHRDELALTVERLPALLGQLRTNLVPLNRVMTDGTPLLGDLRAAAPGLTELTHTLPAFTTRGIPASHALSGAAAAGNQAIPLARPVISQLETFAAGARTPGLQLAELLTSTRDKGGFEGLLKLLYALSTDSAAYDSTSHAVSATINAFPACFVSPTGACDHGYGGPDFGQAPVNGTSSSTAAISSEQVSERQIRSLISYLLK